MNQPIRQGNIMTGPNKPNPGVEYWRVHRVARFLDLSRKRVYQLVREKRLEAIRLGPRQMRISRRSIEEYLQQMHRESVDEIN